MRKINGKKYELHSINMTQETSHKQGCCFKLSAWQQDILDTILSIVAKSSKIVPHAATEEL